MRISRRMLGAGLVGLGLAGEAVAATSKVAASKAPASKSFADLIAATEKSVAPYLKSLPDVPVPKDRGGGYTHERHKSNYTLIREAGTLYAFTGKRQYADLVRDVLLAYAKLYPTLGLHPVNAAPQKGKLFWQSLNDTVWLVEAIQGYAEVRSVLTPAERTTIETNVFRQMAKFIAIDSAETFERIHNHATWAVAGVGMTGYVIDEPLFVKQALYGLKADKTSGFLRQIDLLFSPDGYYTEGPYYQRYAIQPFVVFAAYIQKYDPSQKIFDYRDGMLPKAVYTLINESYDGRFFPINDAIVDKGIDSPEVVQAVSIIYALNRDASLLSVARAQKRIAFTRDGALIANALETQKAVPFDYKTLLLRDGADGSEGGVGILRAGNQALVFKATAQGMGHGHFDRLSWIFYDAGREVVADYGAARYLNVEAKDGGRYLPENETWAKQTVAHNTLVVDEASQFNGDVKLAQPQPTKVLAWGEKDGVQLMAAELDTGNTDVVYQRAVMMVTRPEIGRSVMIDLIRARGQLAHRYDLPMHYKGVFLQSDLGFKPYTGALAPLGARNGYQHLWLKAQAGLAASSARFSWFNRDRFYNYVFDAPEATAVVMAQLGANDPNDNLRPERSLIVRGEGKKDFTFAAVLEPYGVYDSADEYVRDTDPAVKSVKRASDGDSDRVTLTLKSGKTLTVTLNWVDGTFGISA